MNPMSCAVSLTASLECFLMRQTYNDILNTENQEPEKLANNHIQWQTYLEIYTETYNALHKPMIQ